MLDALVGGRVDALHLTPETGLLVLSVWTPGGVRRLVLGIGPRVVGVAWATRVPQYAASVKHPLLAAAKAHLAGRPVRSAVIDPDDGAAVIAVGDASLDARLRVLPGMSGEASLKAQGTEVQWSAATAKGQRAHHLDPFPGEVGDEAAGDEGVRVSDGVAGELRRAAVLKSLRAQAKRLMRRSEAVQSDLARIDDIGRLQRIGRMILAQGGRVPKGATVAVLEDWEEGGTLKVPIDPAVPAKQQAEGFFHEAKRVQRGAEQMWARYESAEAELAKVRALEGEIEGIAEFSPAMLRVWGESARALGAVVHEGVDARGRVRAKAPERLPYNEYRCADGHRVLVGRGAADNDRLTTAIARPQDLWLHARGWPGAHVVVPLQKGEAVPPEVLLDAATLAAHHSDARGQELVEVTWTERRYVRKARKSAVGQVTVDRERVLALRVEPARLARLLAGR